MPKGGRKRTKEEYDKEIEDAIKRFRKYPERLRASYDVDDWKDFLLDIGISPQAINAGYDSYWENIRKGIVTENKPIMSPKAIDMTFRELTKKGVRYIEVWKDREVYKEVYKSERIAYRDIKTGRFIKGS